MPNKKLKQVFVKFLIIILALNLAPIAHASEVFKNIKHGIQQEKEATEDVNYLKNQTPYNTQTKFEKFNETIKHQLLMEKISDVSKNHESISPNSINDLKQEINDFAFSEKNRLEQLNINQEKIDNYIKTLNYQKENIGSVNEKLPFEIGNLQKPSSFKVKEIKEEKIQTIENIRKFKLNQEFPIKEEKSIWEEFGELKLVETAEANWILTDLPTISDLTSDNQEIQITEEIKLLANELNRNPVQIVNFLTNEIKYETYFGAKKGAAACLKEKSCNDADLASLAIALFRASSIPARYKKALIEIPITDLQNLLGTETANNTYAALKIADIPTYTSNGNLVGDIDQVDLSQETHLIVQLILPEFFYEYDQRGTNFRNTKDYETATSDAELAEKIKEHPRSQWIQTDLIFSKYQKTKKTILVDTAQLNVETFWEDFFKQNTTKNPYQAYKEKLLSLTNKNLEDHFSTNDKVKTTLDFLPPTLPFEAIEGTINGNPTITETFTVLPDSFKNKVEISLLKASDRSEILKKSFFGSEINNSITTISYDGFSATDESLLQSYGSVSQTPPALVDIKAYLQKEDAKHYSNTAISIGDDLILSIDYSINGQSQHKQEKFSIAGNHESIYISLSKPEKFSEETSTEEIIIEHGLGGIAKKYISEIFEKSEKIASSLDQNHSMDFGAAVITQKRYLNKANSTPTSFDFKGFNIDASYQVINSSRSGNYKNHQKNFRLLASLYASFYEGQVFNDLLSLEGISTSSGLQYAYANPQTYTVSKVTQANKSIINTFNLSQNTKNQMTAAVDQGRILITPNKEVTDQNWQGLFYITMNPTTGEATYAIGEQVPGNGGDTIVEFIPKTLIACKDSFIVQAPTWLDKLIPPAYAQGIDFCPIEKQVAIKGWEHISNTKLLQFYDGSRYQDFGGTEPLTCNIAKSVYDRTVNNKDSQGNPITVEEQKWKESYGFPCYESPNSQETHIFEHRAIVTQNAAKFYSAKRGGYNYWITTTAANNYVKTIAGSGENVKFNINVGTFSKYTESSKSTTYYMPGGNKKTVYQIKKPIISTLSNAYFRNSSKPSVAFLGFPISNEKTTTSEVGTVGNYQLFAGGIAHIKRYQSFFSNDEYDEGYYIPLKIYEHLVSEEKAYNRQNCSIVEGKDLCTPAGKFGFATGNPKVDGSFEVQEFENGYIIKCTLSGGNCSTVEKSYKTNIPYSTSIEFAEGVFDTFTEGLIFGVNIIKNGSIMSTLEILNAMKFEILKGLGQAAVIKIAFRASPGVGWAITGIFAIIFIYDHSEQINACYDASNASGEPKKSSAYYCGMLMATFAGEAMAIKSISNITSTTSKLSTIADSFDNAAFKGKAKLIQSAKSKTDVDQMLKTLEKKVNQRTSFFKKINNLTVEKLQILYSDMPLVEKLISDKRLSKFTPINIEKGAEAISSGGYKAYKTGTAAASFEIKDIFEGDLIRFHIDGKSSGYWFTTVEEIQKLKTTLGRTPTVDDITKHFALPSKPSQISTVKIDPAKTGGKVELRYGIAGSQYHIGSDLHGGGEQFEILGSLHDDWFKTVDLKDLNLTLDQYIKTIL
jgi:hypothetical protein